MHADADFLAAVAANPHDPLTRLVYADWLDERGDPRGELIRIEEEVRFEPAWSDVLWSQKPRRNELRAMCDPAWLAAMRYGTDCLPLFYGRPFPDHWRDGWRLIREATERWLGVPMPDVGGHADEVAAVEERLGLTLPPSVRELVVYREQIRRHSVLDQNYLFDDDFEDCRPHYPMHNSELAVLSNIDQCHHFCLSGSRLHEEDPPVVLYVSNWDSETCNPNGACEIAAAGPTAYNLPRLIFQRVVSDSRWRYAFLAAPITDVGASLGRLQESFGQPIRCDQGPGNKRRASWYFESSNCHALLNDRLEGAGETCLRFCPLARDGARFHT